MGQRKFVFANTPMNVLALTIMLSLCLAAIFVVFFIYELKKPRRRGIEHQALMPLEEDNYPSEKNPLTHHEHTK